MKIKESDFSPLLKSNFANVPALLISGPDAGKNSEFVDRIIQKLGIAPDNIIAAGRDDLRDRFDAVYSDACATSMFGGDKLALITDPDGRDANLIHQLCESPTLVIVTGDLDYKSGLKKWFEDHETAAALAVYADSEQDLKALIRDELAKYEIRDIEPDAIAYMIQHLGKDRAVARGFLEKISLYVGSGGRVTMEDPSPHSGAAAGAAVTLDDVQKCLPDTGAANMDEFKYNLTAGNVPETLSALDRLMAENIGAGQLTRVLGYHFKDLLACVAGGIMPRVFWKYERLFNAARRIWTESDVTQVLIRLNKLEADTRGAADGGLLMRDFSLKLATKAYKTARRQ